MNFKVDRGKITNQEFLGKECWQGRGLCEQYGETFNGDF